jgi:hypothetical protein
VRFAGASGPGRFVHAPRVPANACLICHTDEVGDWPQIGRSVGHREHLADPRIDCLTCHRREIHRFGGALRSCPDCHHDLAPRISPMEEVHCNACHNFMDERETLIPTDRTCLDCHRERNVRMPELEHHTQGRPCDACHPVHGLPGEALP